ncbi:MAG: CDP-glycerol glycerophosphotransferase family protein [Gammaproteobacteria bacterium]
MAVIGRDDGKFVDNAKYFFLQGASLLAPCARVVFVTERDDVAGMLAGTDYEVLVYPSFRSVWFLLCAAVVVVDSSEWVWRLRRFLLIGAKKVQLWHGVGYKRIELDRWRHEAQGNRILTAALMPSLRKFMNALSGRFVRYDAFNTTSEFYRKEVFEPAFSSRHFIVSGYPRNSFGDVDETVRSLAWKNVDPTVAAAVPGWRDEGRRIVLVAPTYRESRATPMGLTPEAVASLDAYCEAEGVEFLFKFHPYEIGTAEVSGKHLHLCSPDSDFYPLMPLSSALITDYSSIYMDYLLLDNPVLFLVPDLDVYVHKDRRTQFDFNEMTPGPKVENWADLLSELRGQWRHDSYREAREKMKKLAFDDLPQNDAVPKLIAFMRAERWLPENIEFRFPPSP